MLLSCTRRTPIVARAGDIRRQFGRDCVDDILRVHAPDDAYPGFFNAINDLRKHIILLIEADRESDFREAAAAGRGDRRRELGAGDSHTMDFGIDGV